jgi:5-methyltetrahydropteroyltriglutamate--homocysteine methyltransferase
MSTRGTAALCWIASASLSIPAVGSSGRSSSHDGWTGRRFRPSRIRTAPASTSLPTAKNAEAIHHEVAALIAAGCQIIQFDDPVLLRYPDAAQAWGLQALERCFAGLEERATFVVHICRGYPNKPLERKGIGYKANQNYYRDILSWLSESRLDVVSIEGAAGNLDLSTLRAIGRKSIMLGVLDVGENAVESAESLVARANEALSFVPKEQLILAPDCGMLELSRASARAKLMNLALASRAVNGP